MSSPHTTYARLTDTSFEAELGALADICTLAIQRYEECHAKKKATRPGGPDGPEESKNDRTDSPRIHR